MSSAAQATRLFQPREMLPFQVWDASKDRLEFIPEDRNALLKAQACYRHMRIISDFFEKALGESPFVFTRMVCYINDKEWNQMTAWDPKSSAVRIGNYSARHFSASENHLDIIAHEFGHAYILGSERNRLTHDGDSAALNEHLADVIGIMVKQYARNIKAKDSDWLIGKGRLIVGQSKFPIRSMRKPGSAFHGHAVYKNDEQIAPNPQFFVDAALSLSKGSDRGGAHKYSGIPNRAFYLAALAIGGYSWEITGKIWLAALSSCGQYAGFESFAQKTIEAAETYGSDIRNKVRTAWEKVFVLAPVEPVPLSVSSGSIQPARRPPDDDFNKKVLKVVKVGLALYVAYKVLSFLFSDSKPANNQLAQK